jgi:RNA polymerase sigma-70 factor (ECF subfamily)
VTNPFDSIEEHVASVYRYALRLTGRPESAEDLVQETLLRGWRKRHSLQNGRAIRVWLLKIATNLWTDQIRSRPPQHEAFIDERACERPLPLDAADHRENVRLALAAMDELPDRQRQVLYLTTCEGLARAEVATVLDISDASVKSNLSLARKEMRRRLKELYEEMCGGPKVNHDA